MTVGVLIQTAFPRGTRLRSQILDNGTIRNIEIRSGEPEGVVLNIGVWNSAPVLPPDVFAVVALLLELSGAAHHVVTEMPSGQSWARPLSVSEEEIAEIKKVSNEWRKDALSDGEFHAPAYVDRLWGQLWNIHRDQSIFCFLRPQDVAPEWWRVAFLLLICADEAAFRFGFQAANDPNRTTLEKFFENEVALNLKRDASPALGDLDEKILGEGCYTISTIPPDVACVLPKSRTAQVGSTLRSLSHNLALLPPRGKARAIWHAPDPRYFTLRKDSEPLNLLIVPHPFKLPPSSFVAGENLQDEGSIGRWGWFNIDQGWEPKRDGIEDSSAIVEFIKSLVAEAAKQAGPVHAIVLPELSITHATFARLQNDIAGATSSTDPLSSVDILVAGLRNDASGAQGNFAVGCLISRPMKTKVGSGEKLIRDVISNTQQKHHRWRLDQRQINAYGIGSTLTGGVSWWEGVPLLSRSLNVFVFRTGSTLVPLICEDLARLEPIHELVRAVGPNLVIAMLMDGPQVAARWPGRYAMGLADDPGSSVLTVTSLGPVKRASDRAPSQHKSRSIGLWRDQTGDTKELVLDEGASGVLLSLSGQRATERTMDGRTDGSAARVWVFADQASVSVASAPDWAK